MKKIKLLFRHYGIRGLLVYFRLKFGWADKIELPGYAHPIYARKKTSDIPTFHQIFTFCDYNIPIDFSPKTIIDAGANVGYAAVYFANRFPQAKIVCIEPEASNFELLEKNISSYQHISAEKKALSNESGQILHINESSLGNWGFTTDKPEAKSATGSVGKVETINVTELMSKFELPVIDIFKIDIEGAESALFENGFESWLPKTRCIIIELHEWMKAGSSENFHRAISQYHFTGYQKGENMILFNAAFQPNQPAITR